MKNAFLSVAILLALAVPAMAQPQSQLRAGNNPLTAALPSQIDVDTYKLDITVDPDRLKAVKIYVATKDQGVISDDRSDFVFKVEELNPKAEAETASYDAIFHGPEEKD